MFSEKKTVWNIDWETTKYWLIIHSYQLLSVQVLILGVRWLDYICQVVLTHKDRHLILECMPTYLTINVILTIKHLAWHRETSFTTTIISCGQHLNYYVWQLDLSTELRKLTSTVSLSFCRRSCSEQSRTLCPSTIQSVYASVILFNFSHWLISLWLGAEMAPVSIIRDFT